MQRLDDAARWRALEESCQVVLPLAEASFGPENAWMTAVMSWLAAASQSAGRYAEAEALYEQVRAIYEKTLGPEHPSTAVALGNLARLYVRTGRYAEAEQLLTLALHVLSAKLPPPRHPRIARLLTFRGELRAAANRKREAAEDFETALADLAAAGVRPEHRWVREARAGLASIGDG